MDLDWAYNSGKMDATGSSSFKWSARSAPLRVLELQGKLPWSSPGARQ